MSAVAAQAARPPGAPVAAPAAGLASSPVGSRAMRLPGRPRTTAAVAALVAAANSAIAAVPR